MQKTVKQVYEWANGKSGSLILVFGVLVLGFLLRVGRIADFAMWIDESYMYYAVNRPWHWRADVNPPLYFQILQGWSRIFGSHIFSLRALSSIFGTGAVAVTYLLFRDLSGIEKEEKKATAGLIPAFLLAVHPYFVDYGAEARNYSMYLLVGLLVLWCFWRGIIESPRKWSKWWTGYTVFAGLLYWTHYLGIFMPIGLSIFYLGWWFIIGDKNNEKKEINGKNIALAIWEIVKRNVGVVIAFVLWLPTFLDYHSRLKQNAGFTKIGNFKSFTHYFYVWVFGESPHDMGTYEIMGYTREVLDIKSRDWGKVILAGYGILTGWIIFIKKQADRRFWLFFCAGVLNLVIMVLFSQITGYRMFVTRYLIAFGGIIFLHLVYMLGKFKYLGKIFLVLYLIVISFFLLRHQEIKNGKQPQLEKISKITQESNAERIVIDGYVPYMKHRANLLLKGETREIILAVPSQKKADQLIDYRFSLWEGDVIPYSEFDAAKDIFIAPKSKKKLIDLPNMKQVNVGGSKIFIPKKKK